HVIEADAQFFFSRRRRHTRCLSDWSSDVCSSDLFFVLVGMRLSSLPRGQGHRAIAPGHQVEALDHWLALLIGVLPSPAEGSYSRSEERRVGKRVGVDGGRVLKK